MIVIVPLVVALTLLVLLAGYCYGRAETEAHYEPIVDELEQTIEALLPAGITVLP
jgi:hypothetical protein